MIHQLHVRKGTIPSSLDGNCAAFQCRAFAALGLIIAIEKFLKEAHSWFHLKIYITENMEVAQVKDGVRS